MTFHAYKQSQKCGFDLKPFAAIEKRVLEAKTRRQQSIKSNHTIAIDGPVKTIARQLPLWSEGRRAIPNIFVRSALFNARNKRTPRKFLKEAPIFVIGDGSITYTGEELRQDDETVWLQLVTLAKDLPLGCSINFSPYEFLKAVGWGVSSRSYIRLREVLTRLQATSLKAYSTQLGHGVSLSMLPKFEWRDHVSNTALKMYRVTISEELLELFSDNRYTRLEWEQRLSLPTGIATWLHGYFASHRENFPVLLSTIRQGSGIETSNEKHLKESIQTALIHLRASGFISSFIVAKGKVYVSRA